MRKLIVIVGLIVLFLPQLSHAAAVDYFLKIDGIDGESTDDRHKDEIDLLSFSWGMSNGCDQTTELPAVQSLVIVKTIDKATPKLMLACANGQHIKDAKLTCRKAGGDQQEYFTIKLTDILVSSFQPAGDGTDVVPMDQVSLCFKGIRFTTLRYDDAGNLVEVVTEGFAATRDGVIPEPDDYPGVPIRILDSFYITGEATDGGTTSTD